MDKQTGEILEFESKGQLEAAKKVRKLIELKGKPKKSCKWCYGRGYTGYNTTKREYIVCRCIKKEKIPDTDEVASIVEELVQEVTS